MTSSDDGLAAQLAESDMEPYDRPPPQCDECWRDAEPAWDCARFRAFTRQ